MVKISKFRAVFPKSSAFDPSPFLVSKVSGRTKLPSLDILSQDPKVCLNIQMAPSAIVLSTKQPFVVTFGSGSGTVL